MLPSVGLGYLLPPQYKLHMLYLWSYGQIGKGKEQDSVGYATHQGREGRSHSGCPQAWCQWDLSCSAAGSCPPSGCSSVGIRVQLEASVPNSRGLLHVDPSSTGLRKNPGGALPTPSSPKTNSRGDSLIPTLSWTFSRDKWQ